MIVIAVIFWINLLSIFLNYVISNETLNIYYSLWKWNYAWFRIIFVFFFLSGIYIVFEVANLLAIEESEYDESNWDI